MYAPALPDLFEEEGAARPTQRRRGVCSLSGAAMRKPGDVEGQSGCAVQLALAAIVAIATPEKLHLG